MQGYFNSQVFFKGQISNVMVFNKPLTKQELIDLYNCGPFEAPNNIPEFASWTILPLVLTITLFSLIGRKQLHKAKAS